MPRKPNVSAEAVNDLVSQADDLTMEMLNATEEIKAAMREHLTMLKAWIEHWKQDAACNLPCTPGSLALAHSSAEEALKLLTRPEPSQ